MRTMKRQIALLSVLMVLIIAALTLGGLQLFGKGKVKPSEWFKKADIPQAEQTEQETPKTASAVSSMLFAANSSDDFKVYTRNIDTMYSTIALDMKFYEWRDSAPTGWTSFDYELEIIPFCTAPKCSWIDSEVVFNLSFSTISNNSSDKKTHIFRFTPQPKDDDSGDYYAMCIDLDQNSYRRLSPFHVYHHRGEMNGSGSGYDCDSYVLNIMNSGFTFSVRDVLTKKKTLICSYPSDSHAYSELILALQSQSYRFDPNAFSTSINNCPNVSSQKSRAIETLTLDYRTPVALPSAPVKEGYTFVGWYYDSALTQPYDGAPIYADTNLYAKFSINTYTVTYDTAGGSSIENAIVNWNTIAPLSTPTRIGYNFIEWQLSDGTKYENQPIKANTTLTAKWEIQTFKVAFYVGEEKYSELTVEYGRTLSDVMEVVGIASYMAMTTEGVRLSKQNSIITEDTHVVVKELTGWEKYGDFVARNQWYTWTLVGIGGVLLILAIVGIVEMVRKR